MKNGISKEQWVAMFKELGLTEAQMRRWHQLFESRHAQAHQSFLEWLGVDAQEIAQIRQNSR